VLNKKNIRKFIKTLRANFLISGKRNINYMKKENGYIYLFTDTSETLAPKQGYSMCRELEKKFLFIKS